MDCTVGKVSGSFELVDIQWISSGYYSLDTIHWTLSNAFWPPFSAGYTKSRCLKEERRLVFFSAVLHD